MLRHQHRQYAKAMVRIELARCDIVFTHFQRQLAPPQGTRFASNVFQESTRNPLMAICWQHGQVMNIQQRPRRKGGETDETHGNAHG